MATFNKENFNAGNTPKWAQLVGNIGLGFAALGGSITTVIGASLALNPPVHIFGPPTLTILAIGSGIGAAGAILKGFTKFFGEGYTE